MSEGALTRDFDLVRGKWRINATQPGFKVVAVAVEGLRRRLFSLRQIEASEFTALVPFDNKNGEPLEPPAVLHGLPTMYYYYGQTLYLWPPPLHAWRLKVDYAPREGNPYPQRLGRVHRRVQTGLIACFFAFGWSSWSPHKAPSRFPLPRISGIPADEPTGARHACL